MSRIDEIEVAVRAWTSPLGRTPEGESRRAYRDLGPSQWSLSFDTETLTTLGLGLRLGAYQVRKGAELIEQGFFYEPGALSATEHELVCQYSLERGLSVRTRKEFVDRVF